MVVSSVEDLVRQSSFIFGGTIRRLNAATMAAVPVTEETVVVRVDEVLQAPETLGDHTGEDITVQLIESQEEIREGQRAIFFTNGWLYGESIAVQEVGRRSVEDAARLPEQIADTYRRAAAEELQERIARADLVVVGQVSDIYMVEREDPPASEHDPQWWAAIINPESVEKGDLNQPTVSVWFPGSIDVMWYRSPKFHARQEGIWILQRGQVRETYTALDPLDFQPREQLDRIGSLIRVSEQREER
jgi:hypothetical protein